MLSWVRLVLRELRRVFTDSRLALIIFGGPFLYGLLFGGVYWYGRVREVPIFAIDQDNSALSRDLLTAIDASDNLHILRYGETTDDFADAVKRGQVYLCVMIPANFERDLKRGHGARVVVLVDGTNTLVANVTYRSLRTVIATYSAGAQAKRLLLAGTPRRHLMPGISPLQAEFRVMFNPAYNYSTFLLMGLVCIALQQVTMMGAAIALGLECEEKHRRSLLALTHSPLKALLAKTFALCFLMIPLGCLGLYLPFSVFGAAFRGSWNAVLATTALFLLVQVLAGFTVAGICRTALTSVQVLLCLSVPAFLLSGFTWPLMAMPQWLQTVGNALPLTAYADMVRKVSLMGAPFELVRDHLRPVVLWLPPMVVTAYLAMLRFVRPGKRTGDTTGTAGEDANPDVSATPGS